MRYIIFYVPDTHVDMVKNAMFDAGAGQIGDYEHCCWQTKGVGQFRPLVGSNPFKGELNQLEQAEEYKVEMVCADEVTEQVILALKKAHPYEEPAFCVLQDISSEVGG